MPCPSLSEQDDPEATEVRQHPGRNRRGRKDRGREEKKHSRSRRRQRQQWRPDNDGEGVGDTDANAVPCWLLFLKVWPVSIFFNRTGIRASACGCITGIELNVITQTAPSTLSHDHLHFRYEKFALS